MDWWWGECPYSTKTWEVLGNPSPTPKRFPETREISLWRSPREISRVEGESRGRRGWISQYLPSFGVVRKFSSSSIYLHSGMDQEIHPFGQGRIDSVKINPSLLMMREWVVHAGLTVVILFWWPGFINFSQLLSIILQSLRNAILFGSFININVFGLFLNAPRPMVALPPTS